MSMRMRELVETDGSGVWVGAPQYGEELPDESHARFIVERTAEGHWGLSVRGYNDGERLAAFANNAGELAVRVDGVKYPALDTVHRVMPVDAETGERYEEAIKMPEADRGLLVQILEEHGAGSWNVSAPAEYNEYEAFAQLIAFDSEPIVGFAWGRRPKEGERSGELHFDMPLTATIERQGPLFHINPWDDRVRGLSASAVADRVASYPYRVAPNPNVEPRTVHKLPAGVSSGASAAQNLYGH